jgi:hypothetical protein
VPFKVLFGSIILFCIGAAGFFGAFVFREMLKTQFNLYYHEVQTYTLLVAGAGIFLYIVAGLILKISLKNTSYYKLKTIINNEPYDPPRKGDFTKSIRARLAYLSHEWALFSEVKPPEAEYRIPQVIVGPGGVYAIYPSNKNASRRSYPDAGPFLKKASQLLEKQIGHSIIPIILFPTPKLASIYKEKRTQKTRVMHIMEFSNYFEKRKRKIDTKEQKAIEAVVYNLIEGTPPGI